MSLRGLNKTILVAAALSAASPVFAAQTKADYLFEVSGFGITNSMLTTWIFAIIIIALFRAMLCGGAKLVPSKGQLVIEAIVENLRSIMEPLLGKKAFKGAFPLLLGFFAYILIMNWSGLLPGVGSIGMEQIASGTECPEGFVPKEGAVNEYVKFVPFIRPADTDLNTTLALAIISRRRLLLAGSGPPSFTATAISRPIIVKIFPFAASFFSFLCLILANLECPDILIAPLSLLSSKSQYI